MRYSSSIYKTQLGEDFHSVKGHNKTKVHLVKNPSEIYCRSTPYEKYVAVTIDQAKKITCLKCQRFLNKLQLKIKPQQVSDVQTHPLPPAESLLLLAGPPF